jgi:uncharacterized protein (UPF0216 family)
MGENFVSRDSFIEPWLAEHLKRLSTGMPVKRLSLRQLLFMEKPSVPLSNGDRHYFNRNELIKAAELLGRECMDAEVFPLVFISRKEMGSDVYLIKDNGADEIFRRLVGLSAPVSRTRDGQAYTYKSLVIEFIKKYPSLGLITT